MRGGGWAGPGLKITFCTHSLALFSCISLVLNSCKSLHILFQEKKLKLKLNIHFGSLNLHQEVSMYLPASPVCVWDGGWRNSVRGARIWQCQCLRVSLQHGWKSVLHSRRVIKHMALQDSHGTSLMVALLLKTTGLFLLSGKFQGSYLSLNITFSFRWNPGLTGTILWQL